MLFLSSACLDKRCSRTCAVYTSFPWLIVLSNKAASSQEAKSLVAEADSLRCNTPGASCVSRRLSERHGIRDVLPRGRRDQNCAEHRFAISWRGFAVE